MTSREDPSPSSLKNTEKERPPWEIEMEGVLKTSGRALEKKRAPTPSSTPTS